MNSALQAPLDQIALRAWNRIDPSSRRAFFVAMAVSILAFAFEMTNLTLHHDDISHIFIEDTILGHFLGRFGFGRFHYYTQNAYVMPFLQVLQGTLFTAVYGVLIGRLWGLRSTLDLALVASVVCVFPYMAQLYQYNTSAAPFPLAHLMAAGAVVLSVRATVASTCVASLLYLGAFSIYQSVVANAATIFLLWAAARVAFGAEDSRRLARTLGKATGAALAAVLIGGGAYVICVSQLNIPFDSYQSAGDAFSLGGLRDPSAAVTALAAGTRSFFLWPESYFPSYLKVTQLALLVGAMLVIVRLSISTPRKIVVLGMVGLACISPRLLQFLHPGGTYHNLTLTAYAVSIAGAVLFILRGARPLPRNAATLAVLFLLAGYVLQCNWISTVGQLNMRAHFSTTSQILAALRSHQGTGWNGERVAVVGEYEMTRSYPFKPGTGVTPDFMNARHMTLMARLLRDRAIFVEADETMPQVTRFAETRPPWPSPESIGVVNGQAVVVLGTGRSGNVRNARNGHLAPSAPPSGLPADTSEKLR